MSEHLERAVAAWQAQHATITDEAAEAEAEIAKDAARVEVAAQTRNAIANARSQPAQG